MNKDQVLGGALLIIGIAGIIIYGWLVFFSAWQMFVIQLTAFIAIAAVLAIIAWIGYTLATTPPPKPIEEIEKEIEKELSEIKKEEEVKKEETKTN
ncbi:MAG: hypothetical protein QXI49_04200 [Candidatus Methanomethylicaceae archaeon]